MDTCTLETPCAPTGGPVGKIDGAATPCDESLRARIEDACETACRSIAPAWPLDRAIAVNPHWERIGRPLREVAARMAVLGDIGVLPARSYIREAWQRGRISPADLTVALHEFPAGAGVSASECIDALRDAPRLTRLPLLIDVLDDDPARHERLSWRQAITHQVSQTCAAYFDTYQADWQPDRDQGLYAFWRETLMHDHGIGVLMGLPKIGKSLQALPATRQQAESWVLQQLGLPEAVWADYLEAVLLTVNGWASWCAYLRWEAKLSGADDERLRDLLAIRLAWGAILLECKADASARHAFAALRGHWCDAPNLLKKAEEALRVDEVWQRALEIGYQHELAKQLANGQRTDADAGRRAKVEVQAAFCIDVRSEPLRRALEAASPAIQTIGFAGFFGLPIAYTPMATAARRPQLPGLLAPALEVSDRLIMPGGGEPSFGDSATAARRQRLGIAEQWRAVGRWPGTAFSFVEAAGIGYLGKLWQWLKPSGSARPRDHLAGLPARYRALCRPALDGLDAAAKADLAARVLHAMGLDHDLAPFVLLVGHGSQSANNAQAAALDCGACCGQTGEVNARVLAQLLNEAAVRSALAARGIDIPEDTVFAAAMHNTTTDEVEGFDLDLLPPVGKVRWDALQAVLAEAGDRTRRQRASRLGLAPDAGHDRLLAQLRRRASDGAQTRPEWGLAGNAAFIIAPRARSLGADLQGRCFLHDYDASQDADGSILELLMTAPMLVTHWINWQYHASTSDPVHMGSGSKVLHNVVGGHIGVFEGNGGDLRIGLAKQSVHDGDHWIHEPLRLTVVIDAPQDAIERIIGRHAVLGQLIGNGWLHLWRFEGRALRRYADGRWAPLGIGQR